MVIITNNLSWSPRSVCDLYRKRWDIEVFFKQVKQNLKLSNFLGHSANAVRWQLYTAFCGGALSGRCNLLGGYDFPLSETRLISQPASGPQRPARLGLFRQRFRETFSGNPIPPC